jgi:hypothetical protein
MNLTPGWIKNEGPMISSSHTVVDVLLRHELERGKWVPCPGPVSKFRWSDTGAESDIVAYYIVRTGEPTPYPFAEPEQPITMSPDPYEDLRAVLDRAFDQATKGKGAERHAQGRPFNDQPMQHLIDLYGQGFSLGQAGKKMQESMRLPHDRAVAELLGAIVYIAGTIVSMERKQ